MHQPVSYCKFKMVSSAFSTAKLIMRTGYIKPFQVSEKEVGGGFVWCTSQNVDSWAQSMDG